jgi:hypothetical protein
MAKRFETPFYNVTTQGGKQLRVDVTNSISAGLDANAGLIDHLTSWMKATKCKRVLDFGAGALRHSIPLLRKGFEVVAVEYPNAYDRPKAAEYRAQAEKFDTFTELLWPDQFLKCTHRFDVVLLVYVLQVVPVKKDREAILDGVASRLDKNGPRRLYYASRTGEGRGLPDENRYNDGWVRGKGPNDHTFYTEWSAPDTDAMFKKSGFNRVGTYTGAQQGFIYGHGSGVL